MSYRSSKYRNSSQHSSCGCSSGGCGCGSYRSFNSARFQGFGEQRLHPAISLESFNRLVDDSKLVRDRLYFVLEGDEVCFFYALNSSEFSELSLHAATCDFPHAW